MTYDEALARLREIGPELPPGTPGAAPRKFSLDPMRTLLTALSDPQKAVPAVLVAGTNGKGSTSATLAAIGAAAGLKTGLYTSPHLQRVNERIRLSVPAAPSAPDSTAPYPPPPSPFVIPAGDLLLSSPSLLPIADDDFARYFSRVDSIARRLVETGELAALPSFFEYLTATALVYFAEQRVDLAVLEVGLGGRLDATNTTDPLVSVITDIAMDHMAYLGNTLGEIAREKAGILRPHGILVTLSQHPDANAAMGDVAVALDVRGVDAARFLPPRGFRAEPSAGELLGRNRYDLALTEADGAQHILHVDSPLPGTHQQRNLALAIATAIELRTNHLAKHPRFASLNDRAIETGVRRTEWPARLETMHIPGHAPILFDVAHNPAGAWALRSALAELDPARPRTLLFSCLADKPVRELAQVFFPLFDSASGDPERHRDHIVLAPINNPRAVHVDELLAIAHAMEVPAHAAPHLPAAVAQALQVTPPDGVIVVTGSVYLVGEVRALALAEAASHGAEIFSGNGFMPSS